MSNRNTIVFRVDGNSTIGMGHVMRCLSLADELRDRDYHVFFVVSDNCVTGLIQKRGYDIYSLNSCWSDYSDKVDKLINFVIEKKASWLITDSYFAKESYFKSVSGFQLAWITENHPDSMGVKVDLFINYNIYMNNFQGTYPLKNYCLGSKYALLRKAFKGGASKHGENILILTGGSDSLNIATLISKTLVKNVDYTNKIIVVSSSLNPNLKKLNSLSEQITVLIDVEDMPAIMTNARVAVSAGGSTLYELAACGVPTITYSFTDNQIENVMAFSKMDIMPYAGDFRFDKDVVLEKIVNHVNRYYGDNETRLNVSDKMKNVCDGFGASRVADIIYTWDKEKCELPVKILTRK